MRHLNSVNKLNKTASHRRAMLANLAVSVLDKERVVTTLAKAKVVRGVVERLITQAKAGGLHNIRIAAETVRDKTVLRKLFTDIAPSYKDREGGYTRILKLGRRPGDDALQCFVELTGRNSQELALARKKKKKTGAEAAASPAAQKSGEPAKQAESATEADASAAKEADDSAVADVKEPAKPEKPAAPKRKKKADAGEKPAKDAKKKKEK